MTLKKIAELAGTSAATVSRVLNDPNHQCHDKDLVERIWKLAAEQHYTPNTYARDLRTKITEDKPPFTVDIYLTRFESIDQDLFFGELFQYIKEELLKNGCALGDMISASDIMNLNRNPGHAIHVPYKPNNGLPNEQTNSLLHADIPEKKDTGLIILGKCPSYLVPPLKKRYRYIAGIDRNPTDYEYDEVICSGATAAGTAVEYLLSLGHKNIAYIGDCTYEQRYIGYCQTLLNHRIPLNHTNVHPTDQTMESGAHTMELILQEQNRPTAIFCANDMTALGVLKTLRDHRKKDYIPSVISIDNIRESEKTTPLLTTINIPKQEMGHLALSLLLDRRDGRHRESVRIELPCRLLERESCYLCT